VKKESPISCFYEDERAMAFLAIRHINEGHALVIPKKHFETIYDLPDEEIVHLFKIVKKVALAVKESVNAGGITVMQHNGKATGQHIFHVHVHVIPRYEEQELPLAKRLHKADRARLDEVADRIREYMWSR
jgi:histidine triad (HIT) family protein